jgi:hypothetical protein
VNGGKEYPIRFDMKGNGHQPTMETQRGQCQHFAQYSQPFSSAVSTPSILMGFSADTR